MLSTEDTPRRVVVVGGGIAARECVLALHDLAADRLDVHLVAPDVFFSVPAVAVARPFPRGSTGYLPLDRFMEEHGGHLHSAAATRIDAPARIVRCDDGQHERYDVLVVATGGRRRAPFGSGLTFGLTEGPGVFRDVLADLEEGRGASVAFVVPGGATWTLPLYELALLTAAELRRLGRRAVDVHLVTAEAGPVEVFGPAASADVAALLASAGVELHTSVDARVARPGVVSLSPTAELHVDHVVSLPTLAGPQLRGLPHDADGFIDVDAAGCVPGHLGVYAIGDATAGRIKQGGIASQQADSAAEHIAARPRAGTRPPAVPPPLLRGRLLTGHGDRFLQRGEAAGVATTSSLRPAWWPATKLIARRLGPYLERSTLMELPIADQVTT